MAYMLSANMDQGSTEFQIEAAISKIFASVSETLCRCLTDVVVTIFVHKASDIQLRGGGWGLSVAGQVVLEENTRMRAGRHVCIHICMHVCMHAHTRMLTHTHTHSHSLTHSLTHSRTHARTHAHTHRHTHTHTHTHCWHFVGHWSVEKL